MADLIQDENSVYADLCVCVCVCVCVCACAYGLGRGCVCRPCVQHRPSCVNTEVTFSFTFTIQVL